MAADRILLEVGIEPVGLAEGILDPLAAVSVSSKKAGEAIGKNIADGINRGAKGMALGSVKKQFSDVEKIAKELGLTTARASQLIEKGMIKVDKATEGVTKEFKTAKSELRELSNLISSGKLSGAPLQTAIERAGQLKDNIQDTNQLLSAVGSDTRGIDTFVTAAQGLAATFSVAAGSIALFTDDADAAAEITQKAQGALALLTGVQEIARIVTDRNALSIGGLTVVQRANNILTVAATGITAGYASVMRIFGVTVNTTATSLKFLKGALLATGVGALIVGFGLLVSYLSDAGDKADEFSDSIKSASEESTEALNKLLEAQINLAAAQGKISEVEQKRALRQAQFEKDRVEQRAKNNAFIALVEKKRQDESERSFTNFLVSKENREKEANENAQNSIIAFNVQVRKKDKANYEALQADLAAITIESDNTVNAERKKNLSTLLKDRVNAELEAERAKLQLIKVLTSENAPRNSAFAELDKQAAINLIEFELKATKSALKIEQEERINSVKATEGITNAIKLSNIDSINNEIQARTALAEKQTKLEVQTINKEARNKNLQSEIELNAALQQIELARIKLIADARLATIKIIRDRQIQAEISGSAEGTEKRLKAENKAIIANADDLIRESRKIESERTAGMQIGSEERIAIEIEEGERRKTIELDANNAILLNDQQFYAQRAAFILDTTVQIVNGITSLENALLERRITDIQTESDFILKTGNFTSAQRLRQEEITAAKIAAIKRKQAVNEKVAAVFSIILNTARSVMSQLAEGGPALAIAAGILGALQLATAIATPLPKFAKGGRVGGSSHLLGGSIIEAERDEFVVRKDRYRSDPKTVEAFNSSQREWDNHVYQKYVYPQLLAERMRSAVDSGRSMSEADRKIEVRTGKLEQQVARSRKAADRNASQIVSAINTNKTVNDRSKW